MYELGPFLAKLELMMSQREKKWWGRRQNLVMFRTELRNEFLSSNIV